MMKAIKMYWNNTTLIYKITALLLLPLVVIFTSRIPVLSVSDGSHPEFSVIGFGILIGYILLEVFTDGWNFSGIYGKEFRGIELVKASTNGMKLYGQMLIVDGVRRCLYFGILAGICMRSVASGVIMGAVATFVIIGSRFFAGYVSNLLFSYLAPVLAVILVFCLYEGNLILQWGVALLLAIIATILEARLAVRRMERSYYDRED